MKVGMIHPTFIERKICRKALDENNNESNAFITIIETYGLGWVWMWAWAWWVG
jgi:hypothetical protein